MKTKHALALSAVLVPVCTVLRILQYATVIDANGYFRPRSGLHTALIYALYGALALTAVCALLFMLFGQKERLSHRSVLCDDFAGILLLAAAVVMVFDFGICAGGMLQSGSISVTAVLELLTAVYFAVLGCVGLAGGKLNTGGKLLGLFPPIYTVAYAITEFFSSFEQVHVSQTQLQTLTVCALALVFITVNAVCADTGFYRKRLDAVCMLYAVLAAPTALSGIYALTTGRLLTDSPVRAGLFIAMQVIFIAFAFVMMVSGLRAAPQSENEPEPGPNDPPEDDFNDRDIDEIKKYIDSIDNDYKKENIL